MYDPTQSGAEKQQWSPVLLNGSTDRTPLSDRYYSFIPGKTGIFERTTSIPKGFSENDVNEVTHFVLKPDGDVFRDTYSRVGSGSTKGDVESRRTCFLRHLLPILSKAQFIGSGGTDASFHIVIQLDADVSEMLQQDRPRILKLFERLRLITFCDKLGKGILSSQTARVPDSINSKTNTVVTEIQPSTGTYTLAELEAITAEFFRSATTSLFRGWFGIADDQKARCPFHDSKDPDLTIDAPDVDNGALVCYGSDHCAKGATAVAIRMLPTKKKALSLSALILKNPAYLERWVAAFESEVSDCLMPPEVNTSGKPSIVFSSKISPDDLLYQVAEVAAQAPNRRTKITCF